MEITEKVFEFVDELGPEKIVFLYEPRTKMKAVVVVDNVAAGPAIGGVRMASDVTATEVRRLARAMTYKNAMAGLPHGGGKSGIMADPKTVNMEQIIRTFARGIKNLQEYIPGPDMGTDESCMAYIYDETCRAVGLPVELGGIPLSLRDRVRANMLRPLTPSAGPSTSSGRQLVRLFSDWPPQHFVIDKRTKVVNKPTRKVTKSMRYISAK